MRQTDRTSGRRARNSSDLSVWQYCRTTDAAIDEAERFLDLAGFIDGRLDADERERVAAVVAADPDAAADVAAARTLAATAPHPAPSEHLAARAAALVGEPGRGRIVPFRRLARPRVVDFARWGSLAAAILIASWLGFALGSDASLELGQIIQPRDDGVLSDMINPADNILRNITDGPES